MFGILGSTLVAVGLSPFGFGQLAFLSIAPWAWLTLDGRRIGWQGYLALYGAGLMMWIWLFLIEVDLGNGALARMLPLIAYLSLYVPLFVGLGRIASSFTRLPAYVSLPVVWCGLEWLRCHLFGGFSLGMLAHAAADTRRILQLTDIMGSYGLGMLMVASGASVAELFWITRRIRHLERRLPKEPPAEEEPKENAVFTSANRFLTPGFLGRPAKRKKLDARESMEAAVRRNRDHARNVHLMSVTFSVAVIVAVLVFANSYGRSRVVETRTWKLFETNLFGITVLGQGDQAKLFREEIQKNAKSLLVAGFAKPVSEIAPRRPVLVMSPDTQTPSTWLATLYRNEDEINAETLQWDSSADARKFFAMEDLPSCRFIGQPADVPLNLLATVSPTSNIEQTVNDQLRSEHQLGKSIDVTIVAIEPGILDGSNWPRLLTRSVIASAVANRCPVIACVPGRMSAVANGDGDLWWSSALQPRQPEGNPTTEGQSTQEPIRVQAMIDPRVSYFVSDAGSHPAMVCGMIVCLIPIAALLRNARARRKPRNLVPRTGRKASTAS